ncbi:PAC2-involved in the stabilization of microtubles [Teratosphaeria destructans]|uniref:PAC2-involved in the stabilization of microtubles n=1 Tax=Teratosphaeria destructans TaxID=418781 RepID=A0A9W7W785_9PEZI|nr:PAC2-involved in the stabilization of microtubles [Teratosphaeria destructans]
MAHHIDQRLSLKGQLCTVRYIGNVADKGGQWLGVEWDDPARGKHDGTHNGVSYFQCRSTSPTCASFLRPNQPWDKERTFLEALREKYMSQDVPSEHEAIQISRSKQAEEVGFSKFAARQAELRGIHNIVLDHMCIRYSRDDLANDEITEVCKDVTDLDIGSNLFENISDILDLASCFPKLRSLTIDGNRVSPQTFQDDLALRCGVIDVRTRFRTVKYLSVSKTLIPSDQMFHLRRLAFSTVETLVACNNEWSEFLASRATTELSPVFPKHLSTIDLSGNLFMSIEDVGPAFADGQAKTVVLKNCNITTVNRSAEFSSLAPCLNVEELDLRHNDIASWTFFNSLAATFPNLLHLRTTGNPLYQDLMSAEGKPLSAEDGYMLTIARIATLQTLNYSKITDKERLNAETYYLNQIAISISSVASVHEEEAVKAAHPRWTELCEEYGEPIVLNKTDQGDVDPSSLAARLLHITFVHANDTWEDEVPKAFSIYDLLGMVGKRLGVMPLKLRLVHETGEKDPVRSVGAGEGGPDWWDSSDEDEGSGPGARAENRVERHVELVAGTRPIGTYIEGSSARVRVEHKHSARK